MTYAVQALEVTTDSAERAALLLRAAVSAGADARHAEALDFAEQAIAAMVVDKMSNMIQQMSSKDAAASGAAPKSDVNKAIDLIKGFMEKNK